MYSCQYNDPDRPFVMGSVFHGKTGGGGGDGNKSKSLTSLSGSVVSLDGDAINGKETKGKSINLEGKDTITITEKNKVVLTTGKSTLTMEGDEITITGGK